MLGRFTIVFAAFFAAGCGESSAASEPGNRSLELTQATFSPHGFASILDAPPAPYTASVPPAPMQPTQAQVLDSEQFARAGRFQSEVMGKVQALTRQLRSHEKGNFVDLYYENEGEPHVVFRFLRAPERTLRKYTMDRRFQAARARYSNEQLRAAADFMMKTFVEDRVILGVGTGNESNTAQVDVAISEPEFRALVARRGISIPPGVELRFAADKPITAINRPLAPEISRVLRIFPRDDRQVGPLNAINSYLKIVLRDGGFRASGGEHDGAFVAFPIGAQLFVDEQGYLAFGAGKSPRYARVGETIVTPGSIGKIEAPALVGAIHKACGAGKVIKIYGMQSAAADRVQQNVETNEQSLRHFRENYGLSDESARRVLEACKKRSGSRTCLMTPPPPPPLGGPRCSSGTKAVHGICRTPDGYARPLSEWIDEVLKSGA